MKKDYLTYCNPIKIPNVGKAIHCRRNKALKHFREIADPDVLYDNGTWYMVASCSTILSSTDGVNWTDHKVSCDAFNTYAPCICKYRDKYYVSSCCDGIYVSDTPTGEYKFVGKYHLKQGEWKEGYPDPDLFNDGDKGLYLYWGCGDAIYGVKLNDDDPSQIDTEVKTLIKFNPDNEWERAGAYNQNKKVAWTEGSCMYYKDGVYYLIYSTAGTEYPTYAMGVYTSDSPLGEFKPQKNNPFLRGKDGFVKGAGHGCVVDGVDGKPWVFYTSTMGVMNMYERRIGMDRVYIDEKKELRCDGPTGRPQLAPLNEKEKECSYTPLSVYQRPTASSEKEGREAIYLTDEHTMSWWQPCDDDTTPWITVSLGGIYKVYSARIVWRDVGLDYDNGKAPTPISFIIEGRVDGEFKVLYDNSKNTEDLCCDYLEFTPTLLKEVRISFKQKEGYKFGITDFTVFGEMDD